LRCAVAPFVQQTLYLFANGSPQRHGFILAMLLKFAYALINLLTRCSTVAFNHGKRGRANLLLAPRHTVPLS
jgi:hypothetical protein